MQYMPQMTESAFMDIVDRIVERAITKAYVDLGLLGSRISISRVRNLIGAEKTRVARMSREIQWFPIGKGAKTSSVECDVLEFIQYKNRHQFSYYKDTSK